MDNQKFEDYLKNRYEDQMNWYDRKASLNQKQYKKWTLVVIILAAITPILAALDAKSLVLAFTFNGYAINEDLLAQLLKISLITISAIVAIGSTILKTFKYQDLWIDYRQTCEHLRHEKFLFDARLGVYSHPKINVRAAFVDQVEAMLMKEHESWMVNTKNVPEASTVDNAPTEGDNPDEGTNDGSDKDKV